MVIVNCSIFQVKSGDVLFAVLLTLFFLYTPAVMWPLLKRAGNAVQGLTYYYIFMEKTELSSVDPPGEYCPPFFAMLVASQDRPWTMDATIPDPPRNL
jgi:hypothetical protein